MTTLEYLATVMSWDDASGTGRILEDRCPPEEARDVDRSLLLDTSSLFVGQRVVFVNVLERAPGGGSPWRMCEVRAADDARHWASVLERLCSAVDHAETDLRVASEVADEDTVADARAAVATARETRDTKVQDVAFDVIARCNSTLLAQVPGFANTIYARGEDDALHAVLDQVDERYRGLMTEHWKRRFEDLAEIRAMDYLPTDG